MRNKRLFATVLLLAAVLSCFAFTSCRQAPEETVQPKSLTWAIGARLPAAEDFFDALPEGSSVTFAESNPFSSLQEGSNTVRLIYRSEKGKRQTLYATLLMLNDTEPPVISGVKDLMAYIGEGISYRSGIILTDNCNGEITLEVDSSAVNLTKEGIYPVVYRATDLAGNTATAQANVHVYLEEITLDMLYEEIDPLIVSLNLLGRSKEQQARAIFEFVHTDAKITYVDSSDKTSWIRAAYFCLKDRKGDCFSYFSLSKAFFERLGIENLDIQRLPGYTSDTHYWSLINIAEDGASAQWYHYDATRLRDVTGSGCLLTDRQVDAFSRIRSNFYLYDRTLYPTTATAEITERPDLN